MTSWLPSDQPVLEQTKSMSRQRGTKHNYKLFSLLHSLPDILVWLPHSIYHMNHSYNTTVHSTNTQPSSSVNRSLPLMALGLRFISGKLPRPQTQVVYLRSTPTSRGLCNSCNMGMRDLPDMYAQSLRAAGPRAEGRNIRQITRAHVISNMYHYSYILQCSLYCIRSAFYIV